MSKNRGHCNCRLSDYDISPKCKDGKCENDESNVLTDLLDQESLAPTLHLTTALEENK